MLSLTSFVTIFTLTVPSLLLTKCDPLVELPLGKIVGTVKESVSGRKFYSFEGVPYAKPPVGANRFEVRFSNRFER